MNCSKKRRINNAMKISKFNFLLAFGAVAALSLMAAGSACAAPPRHPVTTLAQPQQNAAADSDKTLAAMQDELDRARTRLELKIPDTNEPARPYYIQYRILDLDVRTIVAEFGALVSSTSGRNRIMSVDVRVGNNNLDSSNFITDEGFSGFLGSTGTVGIDRDYDSLRQDLWLATDQAFKAAVENFSKKQAFMSRLAKAPSIPDFSPATPTVSVEPLQDSDWTTRNWEQEARTVSAALRQFPQLYSSRVTYHLIYTTSYLLNSDGTKIRANRSLAAIEASLETESDDGMNLHNYYAPTRPLVVASRTFWLHQLPIPGEVRNRGLPKHCAAGLQCHRLLPRPGSSCTALLPPPSHLRTLARVPPPPPADRCCPRRHGRARGRHIARRCRPSFLHLGIEGIGVRPHRDQQQLREQAGLFAARSRLLVFQGSWDACPFVPTGQPGAAQVSPPFRFSLVGADRAQQSGPASTTKINDRSFDSGANASEHQRRRRPPWPVVRDLEPPGAGADIEAGGLFGRRSSTI